MKRIQLIPMETRCLYCNKRGTHILKENYFFVTKTRTVCRDCGRKKFLEITGESKQGARKSIIGSIKK
jgi:hypothetical protein